MSEKDEAAKIDTVVKVADLKDTEESVDKRDEKKQGAITLSTGVVLKPKQVPPMTYLQVMTRFEEPKVPTVMNESMGRLMENPDDPSYKKAVERWQLQASDAMMNVLILFGTEFVSAPKGFSTPEDDDWVEKLRIVGAEVNPGSKNWRYLAWVKSEAAPADADIQTLMGEVGRLSGVSEDDVQASVQSFSSNSK